MFKHLKKLKKTTTNILIFPSSYLVGSLLQAHYFKHMLFSFLQTEEQVKIMFFRNQLQATGAVNPYGN